MQRNDRKGRLSHVHSPPEPWTNPAWPPNSPNDGSPNPAYYASPTKAELQCNWADAFAEVYLRLYAIFREMRLVLLGPVRVHAEEGFWGSFQGCFKCIQWVPSRYTSALQHCLRHCKALPRPHQLHLSLCGTHESCRGYGSTPQRSILAQNSQN